MRNDPYVVLISGSMSQADFLLRVLADLEIPSFSLKRDIQPGENSVERLRAELNKADVVLVGTNPPEEELRELENTKLRRATDPGFMIIPLVSGSEPPVVIPTAVRDVTPLVYDADNPIKTISSLVKILIPTDNSKLAAPKPTVQRFPGRFIKLSFLFLAGTVVALAASYWLPTGELVPILLWAWLGLSSVMLLLLFLNWYLEPSPGTTPRKDVIDIYIKIASSALFILSLVVAWLSFDNTRQETTKNLKLAETALLNNIAEQRSRRFTDALERLGGDTASKRLAGAVALTHLDSEIVGEHKFNEEKAKIDEKDKDVLDKLDKQRAKERAEHWAIMKVLTSHVRQYSPAPKNDSTKAREATEYPPKEITEILQHLGKRKLTYGAGEDYRLDLSGTDLTGYFKGPIPEKCRGETCNPDPDCAINFAGADFTNARLLEADFKGANLQNAKFDGANLFRARFDCADLTGAEFWIAYISEANFSRVQFISDQLSDALADADTQCPAGFTLVAANETWTCKPPVVKEPVK